LVDLARQNSKIFSLGYFSDAGPAREQIEGAGFKEVLIGRGWDEKLLEGTDKHVEPPNKQRILEVINLFVSRQACRVANSSSAACFLCTSAVAHPQLGRGISPSFKVDK
jgi:hypothetical protein